jgi:hypothetical protein
MILARTAQPLETFETDNPAPKATTDTQAMETSVEAQSL